MQLLPWKCHQNSSWGDDTAPRDAPSKVRPKRRWFQHQHVGQALQSSDKQQPWTLAQDLALSSREHPTRNVYRCWTGPSSTAPHQCGKALSPRSRCYLPSPWMNLEPLLLLSHIQMGISKAPRKHKRLKDTDRQGTSHLETFITSGVTCSNPLCSRWGLPGRQTFPWEWALPVAASIP